MGDESSLMMVMMSRRLINCHCSSYLFVICCVQINYLGDQRSTSRRWVDAEGAIIVVVVAVAISCCYFPPPQAIIVVDVVAVAIHCFYFDPPQGAGRDQCTAGDTKQARVVRGEK